MEEMNLAEGIIRVEVRRIMTRSMDEINFANGITSAEEEFDDVEYDAAWERRCLWLAPSQAATLASYDTVDHHPENFSSLFCATMRSRIIMSASFFDEDLWRRIRTRHRNYDSHIRPAQTSLHFQKAETILQIIETLEAAEQVEIQGHELEHRAYMLALEVARPGSTVVRGGPDRRAHWIHDTLRPLRSAASTGGSEARGVDEAGGHYYSIDVDDDADPQQSGQSSAAAAPRTNDGANDNPDQRIVQSLVGSLVPLCFDVLRDMTKGECPELIKVFLYTGLGIVLILACIGITSTKMAKPAMRIVASASMAALTIGAVHQVSEKVYMRWIFGTLGAMGTLAMAALTCKNYELI